LNWAGATQQALATDGLLRGPPLIANPVSRIEMQ